MLAVTRKVRDREEKIHENEIRIVTPSGEVIDVVLINIRNSKQVRIGIQAADNVVIYRRELELDPEFSVETYRQNKCLKDNHNNGLIITP